MLTFETLFAVLQGLPFFYLDHLDPEWLVFCKEIYRALRAGCDPITALKHAIREAAPLQIKALREAFLKAQPIMELPGLSYRQKETLLALRKAGVASLAMLNRTLMQDPAHVHRRLNALLRKGLVVKFVRPDGVFYFAPEKTLEHSVKSATYRIIMELMQTVLNDPKLNSLAGFGFEETAAIPAISAISAMQAIPAMSAKQAMR